MATPYKTSSKIINEWIELYKAGNNAVEIAKRYSLHSSTVYYQLKKAGIKRRPNGGNKGNNHYAWKGQAASVNSIHRYVKTILEKPEMCNECKATPPKDLANISSTYNEATYNRDIKNWEWLCRKCHMIKDGRLEKFKKFSNNV